MKKKNAGLVALLLLALLATAPTSAFAYEGIDTSENHTAEIVALLAGTLPRDAIPAHAEPVVANLGQKWSDVAYATGSKAQKLDVYLPDDKGTHPLIVYVHGGGWAIGDKAGPVFPLAQALKAGYVVASINYRLSGEAPFPAQIFDVKAAVRFLKANAGKYRIDTTKVAAWGDSAGGHLVALLGTSGDVPALEDKTLGNADQSSRVQAVVDWFGPTDLSRIDDQFAEADVVTPIRWNQSPQAAAFLGGPIQTVPAAVKAANPETYLSADAPPFFIEHGDNDPIVPYLQSVHLAEALRKVIGPDKVTLQLFKGVEHGDYIDKNKTFNSTQNADRVLKFLDKTLKN